MPQSTGGGQMNMIQQFAAFKRQMQGRNPQQMVEQLLQSGRMSPQQFEQLKRQASDLHSLLK
jgi:hypothetical protein